MKKILIVAVIILAVLATGGFYFYKQMIPEMAAKAIVKGEYSAIIPKKIQKKIEHVRDTINHRVDDIIKVAHTQGITIEQLIAALNEVDKQEVITTYNKVLEKQTTDPETVFAIAYDNIKIETFDPMILKPAFVKYASQSQIKKGLRMIKQNHLMDNLDMAMAKSVGKQILLEKKEEIEKRMDLIEY